MYTPTLQVRVGSKHCERYQKNNPLVARWHRDNPFVPRWQEEPLGQMLSRSSENGMSLGPARGYRHTLKKASTVPQHGCVHGEKESRISVQSIGSRLDLQSKPPGPGRRTRALRTEASTRWFPFSVDPWFIRNQFGSHTSPPFNMTTLSFERRVWTPKGCEKVARSD